MQQAPQQEKGVLESITGGERWVDMSGKRKAAIIILLILSVTSILQIFASFSAYSSCTPNTYCAAPNPATFIIPYLIFYGGLWLYTLVIYPRRKRKIGGVYQFRVTPSQYTNTNQPTSMSSSAPVPTTAVQSQAAPETGQRNDKLPAWMLKDEEQEKEEQKEAFQEDQLEPTPPKEVVKPVQSSGTNCVFGKDREKGNSVTIPQSIRRQGTYMIGVNGTGKSTLIANLIVQDLEQGLGVCLLDPHGDLTSEVLSRVPESRIEDVILLDLLDSGFPFGLNLFECPAPDDLEQVALTASFVMHVFEKVWGVGTETPLLAQVLRNVTFTLMQNPGTTFAEISLMLQDGVVREKLVENVQNAQVRLFWNTYNKLKPHDQMERTSSTLNKVDAFLTQPIIANIVSQGRTTLDFRNIMDSGKILLVQLNPRLEDISSLVGAVIIGQLLNAALSRKNIPEGQRKQFNLYADEYQRFATSDFATLLSEARKFGVATTIAHQTRSQLDYANKGSSMNAATKVVFRVTGEDGLEVAKEFDTTPPPPEVIGQKPIHVPKQDVIRHLLEQGHPNKAVTDFHLYLHVLLETAGEQIERPMMMHAHESGILSTVISHHRMNKAHQAYNAMQEMKQQAKGSIAALNIFFFRIMESRSSDVELRPGLFEIFAKMCEFAPLFMPAQQHTQDIAIICSPNRQAWESLHQGLVRPNTWKDREREQQWQVCLDFRSRLQTLMDVLAQEPVLVDSGRWEPIYDKPRTYADVQNEIATRLANLPNHMAKIKTIGAEYLVQTLPPPFGVSGTELAARREQVLEQTHTLYCRKRSEIEVEVMKRHEMLMQTAGEAPQRSRGE